MHDPKLPFGTNFCKCAACGEYFTNPYNFDFHRADSPQGRICVHPSKVFKKNGEPRFRLNRKGYWGNTRAHPKAIA